MHKIFQGTEAVKKHVSELSYEAQAEAKAILKDMSTGFLNAVKVTDTYRNQIAPVLDSHGSPSEKVTRLMKEVEHDMNQRILAAKHQDTKAKRLKEKNLVLSFYKKHRSDVLNMFKLDALLSKKTLKEEAPQLEVPKETLAMSRSIMPQIPGDQHQNFLKYLENNAVSHGIVKVSPSTMKATQSEFNMDKVQSMIDADKEYKPAIVSNDLYILDGHHRWLADYNKDKDAPVPVRMIDKPILDLLSLAHRFDGVQYKTVTEQKLPK